MAHFYANIDGQAKTSATRRGSQNSGISAHVRGWNLGVKVVGSVDGDGRDVFYVYQTGGSNAQTDSTLIATVKA
jgi:hypothetical protein